MPTAGVTANPILMRSRNEMLSARRLERACIIYGDIIYLALALALDQFRAGSTAWAGCTGGPRPTQHFRPDDVIVTWCNR